MRDGSTPFWTTAASARLLIERYRAAAALVEHDSDLLSEAGTVSAVQALREDIEKHVNRTGGAHGGSTGGGARRRAQIASGTAASAPTAPACDGFVRASIVRACSSPKRGGL